MAGKVTAGSAVAASVRKFFLDESLKWIARTGFAAVLLLLAAIFIPLSDQALAIWRSPDSLERIDRRLAHLVDRIDEIAGENRIIRQPRGYSYVEEPVREGEPLWIVLYMARTKAGANCTFVEGASVFEDSRGVRQGGSRLKPITQVGMSPERLRAPVDMPAGLRLGRVGVHIVLEYRCPVAGGTETRWDRTDTLFFELLPKA